MWTRFTSWHTGALVLEISAPQLDTVRDQYNRLMEYELGDYINLDNPDAQREFNNFWQAALDKFNPGAKIEV